nr:unnamed protein product [Naegleria fowleri]
MPLNSSCQCHSVNIHSSDLSETTSAELISTFQAATETKVSTTPCTLPATTTQTTTQTTTTATNIKKKQSSSNGILKRRRQNSFDCLQAAQYMIQRIVNIENFSTITETSLPSTTTTDQQNNNGQHSNMDLSNTDLSLNNIDENETCNFLEQILSKKSSLIISGEMVTRGKRTKRVHTLSNQNCQAPALPSNAMSPTGSFQIQTNYQLSFLK